MPKQNEINTQILPKTTKRLNIEDDSSDKNKVGATTMSYYTNEGEPQYIIIP